MNLAFEVIVNFYQGVLIIYFCKNFFEGRKNIPLAIACIFSTGVFLCVHEYYNPPIPDTIVFLSGFIYMSITKRGTWLGRILCCVLLAAIWIACISAVNESFSLLFGIDVETLLHYNQNNRMLYLLTSNIFITIWVFIGSRIVRRNQPIKIPYGSAFLFLALLTAEWFSSELVFAGSARADNGTILSVSTCFLMLFILLMTLLIYDYFCKTLVRASEAENEARMLIDSQKHQGDLNDLYQALMRTQHDMKHRIAIAEALLKNDGEKNSENVRKALTEGIDTIEVFKTGNETMDAVLTAKYATAKANKIEFRFQPYSLQKHPMTDISFGILISNLLDNALEALKEVPDGTAKKYIELGFSQKMDMFCISCVNPTNEEHVQITSDQIRRKRETGHGYGLDSIKQTVETNNGKCIITSERYLFCVNIIIPFGEEENNDKDK